MVVNEDMSVATSSAIVETRLSENAAHLLGTIRASLPLLSDLMRADLIVYLPGNNPGEAVMAAESRPATVPSVFSESQLGRIVIEEEERALFRVLRNGAPQHEASRVTLRGTPYGHEIWPIKSEGKVIGALGVVVALLERGRQRKKSIVFRRAIAQVRQMVLRGQLEGPDNISRLGEHVGPLVVGSSGAILYISSIAEALYRKLGYTHSLLKTKVQDLKTDESVVFQALETGTCTERPVQENALWWVKQVIPLVPKSPHALRRRLFGNGAGEIEGAIVAIHDVTEERQKEQELKIKSTMIKEIHHRVKNNLQTVAALLRLQSRRTDSAAVEEILRQTISRILSIAFVHEFLSLDASNVIDVKEILQRIIGEASRSALDPEKRIRFLLEGATIYLPAQQATSCALIVNELLQNAVEHGYNTKSEGTIAVSLADCGSEMRVEVVDDGEGLGPDFDLVQNGSLGLHIVQTLVREDLKGRFELTNGLGVRAVVTFPKSAASTP